ncbi:MAG TPA: phosphoribosyltransferase [Vulgatibacter sp.]|nr:phosphoribosyltransferase [Vulgatibacter sp.]
MAPKTAPQSKATRRPARTPTDRSQGRKAGLRELDWPGFAAAARAVAGKVSRAWEAELVVGLAKGGVFAGEEIASALNVPFFPVRIHSRSRDKGAHALGASTTMPADVAGRRVLVVDDIAGTGASLGLAREAALAGGAIEVRTAAISRRESGFLPDFWELETDDLVVFPWDYEPTTGAVGSFGDEDPGEAGA